MNRFVRVMMPMICASLLTIGSGAAAEKAPPRCFELRIYYANEGKLNVLNERFREHTTKLFTSHGMTNVAYWMPVENPERKLVYLMSYPDLASREASWKAFQADPEWTRVQKASEANGPLVAKVESRFLALTDFSPEMKVEEGSHVFEMRNYTAAPGNLPLLLSRFRDHTLMLFTRHGMKHFAYFTPLEGQPGADNTLIYFLIHASPEACKTSFDAFRTDPEWIKVKADSETAGGGSLTVPDGVKSELLKATDFSPVP
ncbi:MAG: NIPSNAP family protein [Luteolibacter sp.]